MPDRLPEHADVLIVGAGPAGLAAAIELKRLGVGRVAVADREPEAGGIPRLCHHTGFGLRDLRRVLTGPVYAHHYRRRAQEAGVLVHPSTTITGWPGANKVSFTSPQGLGTIEARAILLATGCRERPRPARLVPGTRPQGIFTTGSLQRFVYEHHLPVGYRAVIVGAELVSLSALLTLHHAGVKTAAFLNELPEPQLYFPYNFAKTLFADLLYRTPIFPRVKVTNIIGRNRLEGVEVTHLDSDRIEQFECDTVVFTGDWIPEHELARLGGLMIDVGTRGPQVDAAFRTSARGVFAAGNLLRGAETADASALEGKSTATHIHRYLGDETWPERALSIQVEPPLTWVCPNALSALDVPPTHFRFRSAEFRDNVQLQIRQGNKVLHRQTFRRLIVNESMPLADKWLSKVDLAGEPLKFSISPISNF